MSWQPPTDPRARPPEPTRGQKIAGWACFIIVMIGAAIPLALGIIGLVHTWHGGTWTP